MQMLCYGVMDFVVCWWYDVIGCACNAINKTEGTNTIWKNLPKEIQTNSDHSMGFLEIYKRVVNYNDISHCN